MDEDTAEEMDEETADPAAALAAVRHDLGKYIALNLRWLPDNPPIEELRDALRLDLLATRSGPDGTEDAVTLWRRLRPLLTAHGFAVDPLDALMDGIGERLPGLEAADADGLRALAGLAVEVGGVLRRMR